MDAQAGLCLCCLHATKSGFLTSQPKQNHIAWLFSVPNVETVHDDNIRKCICSLRIRVKSGIFGQTAKFGQSPCLFHSSYIGIKNKLTKQTVKILMRRLIRSRLIWMFTVCKRVSEFT